MGISKSEICLRLWHVRHRPFTLTQISKGFAMNVTALKNLKECPNEQVQPMAMPNLLLG